MTHSADIVRTGRKFEQVLEGAREIFMAEGFEGASVDEIAKAAGVSKATLYSYFPDKRLLFVEVVRAQCDRMADRAIELISECAPPRQILTVAAGHIVRFLLSDFAQRIFRICVAERDRFPELGQSFYANGPQMGKSRLAEYLSDAVARGELRIEDIELAAEQFQELCKTRLWLRAAFGIQEVFSEAEIDYVIDNAVETFMARYGAK